jgi:iron complex transport system permease protein
MQSILLTGVMLSFISSSLILFFMAVARQEDLHGIIFWLMGSLEEPNNLLINLMLSVSAVGLICSYFFPADLNALALGEEEALHLGINTERAKKLLFLLASALTGCAVSVGHMIGFVGLVIPHFMRLLTGPDHRLLLFASSLAGASFLIACDTLARTIIAPQELPVGVITGIIGGVLFIFLLNKNSMLTGSKK